MVTFDYLFDTYSSSDLIRITLIVLILVIVTSGYLFTWIIDHRDQQPPGPTGLPVLGYYPFVRSDAYNHLTELSNIFQSPLIRVNLLNETFVFLNTYETIKEAFGTKSVRFSGRPLKFSLFGFIESNGITYNEGPDWNLHRKFLFNNLIAQGMGQSKTDQLIQEVGRETILLIQEQVGRDFDCFNILTVGATNVVTQLLYSKKYKINDEDYLTMKEANEEMLQIWPHLDAFLSGSVFKLWKGILLGSWRKTIHSYRQLTTVIMKMINERVCERVDPSFVSLTSNRDYLDAFLNEYFNEEKSFTLNKVSDVIVNMFLAGTETTSSTLYFALNYMASYPQIQHRVQEEIDSKLGQNREPGIDDRVLLPFTEAVIDEVHRYSCILPFGLVRSNFKDETVADFLIKQRTNVIANNYAVTRDGRFFKYPNEFNPYNFYEEKDGCGSHLKIDAHMPFSIGKRNCVGEPLARQELFIFFVQLMRAFEWLPPEGESKCDYQVIEQLPRYLRPYKIRAVERKIINQ